MDDRRIERALRQGPPDEPAYHSRVEPQLRATGEADARRRRGRAPRERMPLCSSVPCASTCIHVGPSRASRPSWCRSRLPSSCSSALLSGSRLCESSLTWPPPRPRRRPRPPLRRRHHPGSGDGRTPADNLVGRCVHRVRHRRGPCGRRRARSSRGHRRRLLVRARGAGQRAMGHRHGSIGNPVTERLSSRTTPGRPGSPCPSTPRRRPSSA